MWFFYDAALFRFYHFALCLHHVFLSEQIKMMMMMNSGFRYRFLVRVSWVLGRDSKSPPRQLGLGERCKLPQRGPDRRLSCVHVTPDGLFRHLTLFNGPTPVHRYATAWTD